MEANFYKAGVLIIGSLLWDNTKGRKQWREHSFGENYFQTIVNIAVPIKYGRFSTERGCPTMVFSEQFRQENKMGIGKFLPFKNQNATIDQLISAAHDLSEAEGNSSRDFIKGGQTKWCILVCWLNPEMDETKKDTFLDSWVKEYNLLLGDALLDNFKMENEPNAVFSKQGLLQLNWPAELKNYDIVMATQTQPRKTERDRAEYLNEEETAAHFFQKPEYFLKNVINGCCTFDDNKIVSFIKEKDMKLFRKNAINNNCSEIEIDRFIQLIHQ